MTTSPKITARDLTVAATRLLGVVVLDVAGVATGPAVYVPRLSAFASIEDTDELLGDDDGTLVVLVQPGLARELIAEHGTAGRAAAAVNRELAAEYRLAR